MYDFQQHQRQQGVKRSCLTGIILLDKLPNDVGTQGNGYKVFIAAQFGEENVLCICRSSTHYYFRSMQYLYYSARGS